MSFKPKPRTATYDSTSERLMAGYLPDRATGRNDHLGTAVGAPAVVTSA